ncbi:MAG: peptide deformylase [Bifidobacteriaceae bacterium]|jgi:peptide deformylase|nr:peptide deformylase [Bifidobacteriaceae bacterium]
MSHRDIVIFPDPVLRTPCDPILDINQGVKQLVEDLLENVNQEGRAGLAANQIGVSLQAFSWNIEGEIGYILNPEITYLSKTIQETEEGCLSIPTQYYLSQRSLKAKCRGIDLDGKTKIICGENVFAKMIQHECGHLKGQLFIDILQGQARIQALRDII